MKSDAVTLTVDMRFAAERIDEAILLLVSVSGRIEAKPGCRDCRVSRDSISDDRVRHSETWATEAAFCRHLQSEEFRPILFAMELCYEEPEVVIGNFSGHTGLSYLQQLCDRQEAG